MQGFPDTDSTRPPAKKTLDLFGTICQILYDSAGHIVEFWQLFLKIKEHYS